MSGLQTRGASGRGSHSRYELLAKGLGYFSIGLGVAELLGATSLCRALGMNGRSGLLRAYGAREIATGVSILMSHDPTPWIWGRVGGDVLDLGTLAGVANPRDDRQRMNVTLATAAVAGVAILDAACAFGLSTDKRLSAPGVFDYSDRTGFRGSPRSMRGAASDFEVPADYRVPGPLRPWTQGHSEERPT